MPPRRTASLSTVAFGFGFVRSLFLSGVDFSVGFGVTLPSKVNSHRAINLRAVLKDEIAPTSPQN